MTLWYVAIIYDTEVRKQGKLTDKELRIIREFIKDNYKEMYMKWSEMSDKGYYVGKS